MAGNEHPTLGDLIGAEQWAKWWDSDHVICLQLGQLPRVWSGGMRSREPMPALWYPTPDTVHQAITEPRRLHKATVWTENSWWTAEWVPSPEPVSWEDGDICEVRGFRFEPYIRWINHTRPPLPPRS